jgi:hypothetical protein
MSRSPSKLKQAPRKALLGPAIRQLGAGSEASCRACEPAPYRVAVLSQNSVRLFTGVTHRAIEVRLADEQHLVAALRTERFDAVLLDLLDRRGRRAEAIALKVRRRFPHILVMMAVRLSEADSPRRPSVARLVAAGVADVVFPEYEEVAVRVLRVLDQMRESYALVRFSVALAG